MSQKMVSVKFLVKIPLNSNVNLKYMTNILKQFVNPFIYFQESLNILEGYEWYYVSFTQY